MEELKAKIDQEKIEHPATWDMAPKAGLAAILALAVVAAGVGFVIYKRRNRRSLMKRLHDAMPEMDEIRASLKRPLERAVKVL